MIILVAVLFFCLGAGLAGYFAWRGGMFEFGSPDLINVRQESADTQPEAASSPNPEPSATAATEPVTAGDAAKTRQAMAKVAQQQGGLDQRVAAMEQRLTRLDLQAQAAAGNAARAEGLLIAFATRRAIERGAPLGYLADQLRLRFGDARPNAVRKVIEISQDPVTLDQLVAQLEGLSSKLVQAPDNEGTWDWLSRELSDLFVIRAETSPSPAPQQRLDRARLFLESGRINSAIGEVSNLPNASEASAWIDAAQRYAAGQEALDLLETTAILEPRELRNGAGERVEQPSPIGDVRP
ncbi:hypothetical protein GRI91_04395 [Altererythrobacter endophyticus]|uniref:Uncharacterized protein n=1 Tax=Altericroceibacterium endophyticum TaxID=1808508 RepID=A0A6I4T256_9SPHN|nr:hypothetical protein [Altericroceibacterium endophyticum]